MAAHRDTVVALFEKHRATPGAPFDEAHFLDFLVAHPKGKGAVRNSFRGLRRFNAFLDDVQYHFAICFSIKDREANYALDRFVERVKELETSRRSSLASLKNQIKAGPGWMAVFVADFVLVVVAAVASRIGVWALTAVVAVAILLNGAFLKFAAREKRYHARLLARIEGHK